MGKLKERGDNWTWFSMPDRLILNMMDFVHILDCYI